MTTKTISAYLEDERKKDEDAQQRTDEEAARIKLQRGHHRSAKEPRLELPSLVKAERKARKPAAVVRNKPRTARKKSTKARKAA
jgi:hypothetical protein